jgi:hypothetical protein
LEDLVHDAFARADEFHEVVLKKDVHPKVMPNADNTMEANANDMEEMIRTTIEHAWKGCSINQLQARMIFMNMCHLYGVPNTFLDELLTFLLVDLFPQGTI